MKKAFICLLLISLWACSEKEPAEEQSAPEEATNDLVLFEKLAAEKTGVDFNNLLDQETFDRNIYTFNYLYNGGGVASGDINNDGLADLYFTGNDVADRLYLNKGDMVFEDISETAGIVGGRSWNTGVQMVDINNDGWLDIYVCRGGFRKDDSRNSNLLYINNGDNTFSEKSREYGINDPGFSIDAVFFDADNDGDLDLYVTNRPGEFFLNLDKIKARRANRDIREEDQFYRNEGNNKFARVTRQVGIDNNFGFGLSVTAGDLNGDGYQDLYVSNDFLESDYLYMNQGDGTFREMSKEYLGHVPFYSMGTDIMDINNDGWEDIFTSEMLPEDYKRSKTSMASMNVQEFNLLLDYGMHYQYMHNALQLNRGKGYFSEIAQYAGVKHTDWSWATFIADLDNDGWRDLFVANGYKRDVYDNDANSRLLEWEEENAAKPRTLDRLNEYLAILPINRQVNYVYRNAGDYTFEKKNTDWGFREPSLSNGATLADLDNDGDLDLVINNLDQEAFIYRNKAEELGRHYLRVKLEGSENNRNGLGAVVSVRAGDAQWHEQLKVSRGYQSCTQAVAHFGLGDISSVDEVKVKWHDGSETITNNITADQEITIRYSDAVPAGPTEEPAALFSNTTESHFPQGWKHRENDHDDYRFQILLPHKMSELGPMMASGDMNGDGRTDLFVGGAKDQAGQLFLQNQQGQFIPVNTPALNGDKTYEDAAACMVDVDNDGDLDLYVVSGGTEFRPGSGLYQDRLYLNDGTGNLLINNMLPEIEHSGSCVIAEDFNGDGQLDFLVGGRVIPEKYPYPPKSYLLIHENGKWVDKTDELAPVLNDIGMVTKALVSDVNGDGKFKELILAGEWMSMKIFDFSSGKFTDISSTYFNRDATGWWFGLIQEDLDGDGDLDIIGGNLGKNYKFKASVEKPFHIYCDDFDDNGSWDIVLAKELGKNKVPIRGRQCSSDQMPFIEDKFPTYNAFADAELGDIYGEELQSALHYEATLFKSGVWENTGSGFTFHAFPPEAQFAPIRDMLILDFDGDGKKDVVAAGNMYQSERETTRGDASVGLVLKNKGNLEFESVPWTETGWFVPGDVRDLELINDEGRTLIVVATNDGPMRSFSFNPVLQ